VKSPVRPLSGCARPHPSTHGQVTAGSQTPSVFAAQSADIDTVSGATVTSDGYKESLQSALDAAHLS
jgi:uncharacterized protein with FMN-binding domain